MKKVAVIMSTYNGSAYLNEQISSILDQKDVDVELYIFDDLSKDNTAEIVKKWMELNTNIYFRINYKNLGAKKSFLSGLQTVTNADYYAFSDQDDVWDKDKLITGVNALEDNHSKKCKLYFSTARIVDENLVVKGTDNFDHRVLSFGEVLTRNNGIGCTFIFNNNLKKEIDKLKVDSLGDFPLHDQYIYAICASLNGYIYFDSISHINYRQHNMNEVGGKKRSFIKKIFESGIIHRDAVRIKFIQILDNNYKDVMSIENKLLVKKLLNYRNSLKDKLKAIVALNSQMKSLVSKIEMALLLSLNRF